MGTTRKRSIFTTTSFRVLLSFCAINRFAHIHILWFGEKMRRTVSFLIDFFDSFHLESLIPPLLLDYLSVPIQIIHEYVFTMVLISKGEGKYTFLRNLDETLKLFRMFRTCFCIMQLMFSFLYVCR